MNCPGCSKDDFIYDANTDQFTCPFCKLVISGELADAIDKGTPVWISQDMRCFRIEDMETSHIQACVGMIFRKNNGWRGRFMEPLLTELKKRLEMGNEKALRGKEVY